VISKRPVLGYGYGAIWNLHGFRVQLALNIHESVQLVIGDNGFIDIWLHLGIIGVFLMAGLIVMGFVRGVKYFLQERTIESTLPVVLLVFVVMTNITLSLIP